MKAKTKLIMSIMSVCLVCAVFAIGVFALRTANLKIGGDVSFSATGVEADIKNATLTGATTNNEVLAIGSINTTMTQTDIDSKFQNWQTLELDFNENADDIELKFEIANTSTNVNNYIEIDYDYSFTTENPNVDVFPGDENAQGAWENNNYILAPKGATPAAGDYATFTLKFRVLNKELNVPENTKLNLTISLKHTTPKVLTTSDNTNYYYEDIKYTLSTANGVNTATISGYQNSPSDVVIPAIVSKVVDNVETNYVVTGIGNNVFAFGSVQTITLPSSVTSIGDGAFNCGGELGQINLPNSVTYIGERAFFGSGVTTITIPNSVTNISEALFHTSALTSITVSSSVTSIGTGAFSSCIELASITIPASVTSIGGGAFNGCTNLSTAKFENPNGWYIATSADAEGGTDVTTLTADFSEANATVLKGLNNTQYLLRKTA